MVEYVPSIHNMGRSKDGEILTDWRGKANRNHLDVTSSALQRGLGWESRDVLGGQHREHLKAWGS